MKRIVTISLVALAGVVGFAHHSDAQAVKKVKMTIPVIAHSMLPVFLAQNKGFFAEDKLAKWEGDEAPAATVYRASTAEGGEGKSAPRTEPAKSEEKGFFGKLWEKIGF